MHRVVMAILAAGAIAGAGVLGASTADARDFHHHHHHLWLDNWLPNFSHHDRVHRGHDGHHDGHHDGGHH